MGGGLNITPAFAHFVRDGPPMMFLAIKILRGASIRRKTRKVPAKSLAWKGHFDVGHGSAQGGDRFGALERLKPALEFLERSAGR